MTNTSQNVSPQHQHNFNAQGVCGCGLTHDQFRLAEEAKSDPAPEAEQEPAE